MPFAITHANQARILLQGSSAHIRQIAPHATILKVRTRRAAKAILHYPDRFSDKRVNQVESFAWRHAHQLEDLPWEVFW